jgi:alpha-1,3-rhamnosyl/mannosyltransferase
VLTGGEAQSEDRIRALIAGTGLRGRVRRTGRIARDDMLAIVRGAVALTFPSRYEGFGLPALEAMSLGTPVLAGNAASLPEVVDDAGRLIDPDDADAWGEAMLRLLHDGDERERLIAAGQARAAAFSWATTAGDTLAAYRDAVHGGRDGTEGGDDEVEEVAS